jgi:YspA, cpYpsA-related SLOG family
VYTVLVTGDRNWSSSNAAQRSVIAIALQSLRAYTTDGRVCIVHGKAKGVDTIADTVARELGYVPVPYPAEWQKYGRAAGPIRNQQMLDEERPNLVQAFHDDLVNSKGTKDMVKRALRAGIQVHLYQSNGRLSTASFGGRLLGL